MLPENTDNVAPQPPQRLSPAPTSLTRALRALAGAQARRPLAFLAGALLLSALSVPVTLRLGLNGDLTALLPATMPSVRDLDEISRRFGAPQTFALLITSTDQQANRRFVEAVTPELQKIDPALVLSVDSSMRDYFEFLKRNNLLYAEVAELVELRDALRARVEKEVANASPFIVTLDDAAPAPGQRPPDTLEQVVERLKKRKSNEAIGWVAMRARMDNIIPHDMRLNDGFYEHPTGQSVVVFLRTTIMGGEIDRMRALTAAVDVAVAKADPKRWASASLKVEYGGGVVDMGAEQESLADAAIIATLITMGFVALSILLFFFRWRSLPILMLGIVPPILATFAIAQLTVHFLTASSAFLTAIVIGNGINPHIIWLARYVEERRAGRSPGEALAEAHVATWPGTLAASLAAGVAYGSLMLTEFRAFRDFGIIGGVGMVLCWLATFLWTPVLAVLFERLRPIRAATAAAGARSNVYGRVVEWLALARPRALIAISALLAVVSVVAVVRWAQADPIEYDFRNMQSVRPAGPLQQIQNQIGGTVDDVVAGFAIPVLLKSREDAPHVVAQLDKIRITSPDSFGVVVSIDDLLPKKQDEKLPIIGEIRTLMLKARQHVDGKDLVELDRHLPPDDLRRLDAADLPETAARPFIERGGQRGSIVYVAHSVTQNPMDGRYLLRWAGAARAPTNRDGSRVLVTGVAPVIADLVAAIVRDGPRAVAASFIATLILLLFTFWRMRDRLFTLGAHFLGVAWMMGALALLQVKINFLNFVALPVAFGLGVDYGVNVMRRVVEEERAGATTEQAVRASLRETGGAVILCSLTTLIGYISLYTSYNKAVNSFGIAMSIAEVTCLVSAVLVLPAALLVILARRRR